MTARDWTFAGLDAAARDALTDGLSGSELWSLLLEVMDHRASKRSGAELLEQWDRDRFVQPSSVHPRTQLELDLRLYANATAFEPIELSPLAPLGTCSSVALASQHKIISTTRGTEVVSDPTNVLALECARRLKADPTRTIKFATSHRCVRAQPFPKRPGFAAHFRIFCLASAGREVKDSGFTVAATIEHIQTHLRALDDLEQVGYVFADRSVTLLATPERQSLAQRIAGAFSGVATTVEPLINAYYDGLRFMINVGATAGEKIPFIDGGCFDWVGKLAANRKLVYVASAMGSQLAASLFHRGLPREVNR